MFPKVVVTYNLKKAAKEADQSVECVTCHFDDDSNTCQWASIRRNCDKKADANCDKQIAIVSCSGPEYPRKLILKT